MEFDRDDDTTGEISPFRDDGPTLSRSTTLKVGRAADPAEREADRVAEAIADSRGSGVGQHLPTGSSPRIRRSAMVSANPTVIRRELDGSTSDDDDDDDDDVGRGSLALDSSAVERQKVKPLPKPGGRSGSAAAPSASSRPAPKALPKRGAKRGSVVSSSASPQQGPKAAANPAAQGGSNAVVGSAAAARQKAKPLPKPGPRLSPAVAGAIPTDQWFAGNFDKFKGVLASKLKHGFGLSSFGRRGVSVFRSRELKDRWKELKAAARSQAREDARSAMTAKRAAGAHRPNDGKDHSALEAYEDLIAQQGTKNPAKKSAKATLTKAVDQLVLEKWTSQASTIAGKARTAARVAAEREQARWQRMAATTEVVGGAEDAAVMEAGYTAAKQVIVREFERAHERAQAARKFAIKGPGYAGAASKAEVPVLSQDLTAAVKADVTKTEVGLKSVEHVLEADSAVAGVGKVGKFLDQMLGNPGDQASISIEVRVPIPNSPAYIAFAVSGKAARGIDGAMTAGVPVLGSKTRLEIMADVTFRAGADLVGLDVGGSISAFMRSGGDNTKTCMDAFSYGVYRSLPKKAATWWAGSGAENDAGDSLSDLFRAETWAAMVEETAFRDGGAFVDRGLRASVDATAQGKIGTTGIEVGGEAAAAFFLRYNDKYLKKSLGADYATALKDEALSPDRRHKDAKAAKRGAVSVGGHFSGKINGQGVEFSGSLSYPLSCKAAGVEVVASIGYAPGGDQTQFDRWGVELVGGFAGALKNAVSGIDKGKGSSVGGVVDGIGNLTAMVDAGGANAISEGLAKWWTVAGSEASRDSSKAAERVAGFGLSSQLEFALIGGFDTDASGKMHLILRFEIRTTKGVEINATMGGAGLKVEASKTQRIVGIGRDSGEWKAELFGLRLDE